MAFCNQCGTQLPEGAKFCANCGAAAAPLAPDQAANPLSSPRAAGLDHAPSGVAPVRTGGGGLGWILPALVAVAAIAIAYLMFAPRSGDPAAPTQERTAAGGGDPIRGSERAVNDAAPVGDMSGVVSAAVLDSAFNSDPAGAAARYAGPIRVSGVIASMVQPGATPALSMEGRTRFNFMVVNFPAGYRERLASLSKGQFITVSCDGVRQLAGTTILSGCVLS